MWQGVIEEKVLYVEEMEMEKRQNGSCSCACGLIMQTQLAKGHNKHTYTQGAERVGGAVVESSEAKGA